MGSAKAEDDSEAREGASPRASDAEGRTSAEPAATAADCADERAESDGSEDLHYGRAAHGGAHAHWPSGMATIRTRTADGERLKRAIRRLVERSVGPVGNASPRVDPRRLVRELASRRTSLAACRREELEPSLVVIGCDVSGSCSAVARDTVEAAWLVAREDDRVVVVIHSNGIVESVRSRAKGVIPAPGELPGRAGSAGVDHVAWWSSLAARTKLVLEFGDGDGLVHYGALLTAAARVRAFRFVWLNSHCCSRLAAPEERRPHGLDDGVIRQTRYFIGVNSAGRAADALALIGSEALTR